MKKPLVQLLGTAACVGLAIYLVSTLVTPETSPILIVVLVIIGGGMGVAISKEIFWRW